jgi:hypothetical protein
MGTVRQEKYHIRGPVMDFDSISFLISDLLLGWLLSDVKKPETSVNPNIGAKNDQT